MLCNEMRSHPTPDGSSRLVIYLFCVCVRVCVCAKARGGGAQQRFLRGRQPSPSCPRPRRRPPPPRCRPRCCPRAVGAIMTLHIQPPATGPLVRTSAAVGPWGGQGRGPPPAGYFGDIYFILSPVAQSVTAGAPRADRRGSQCSGSMSFGVRGGRRGPRIKAHPINLNFGSAWPAVRGPAGGEGFVGAGKANTPPAAGTSQRRGGVCGGVTKPRRAEQAVPQPGRGKGRMKGDFEM